MTHSFSIKSINDPHLALEINKEQDHDMWLNMAADDRYVDEQFVRIYSWQGSSIFGQLHDQFMEVSADAEEMNIVRKIHQPDAENAERIDLIDAVADKSVLSVFKTQKNEIGLKISRLSFKGKFDETLNDIAWMCSAIDQSSTTQEKLRSERFVPIFELTKTLAGKFNVPAME